MVMEDITAAWRAYKRNLGSLLVGILLIYAIIYGFMLLGLAPSLFISMSAAPSVLLMIVMVGLSVMLAYVLQGGYIRMCQDALKGKAKIGTMMKAAKKSWKSFIGAGLIVISVIMLVYMMFFLPMFFFISTGATEWILLGSMLMLVGYIMMFVLSALLVFSLHGIAIDNYRAVESVKRSYRIGMSMFLSIIALMIILMVAIFALAVIPAVLIFFVINLLSSASIFMNAYLAFMVGIMFAAPMQMLGLTSFYLRNRKKVKTAVKKKR